jgi:hypothetical protein
MLIPVPDNTPARENELTDAPKPKPTATHIPTSQREPKALKPRQGEKKKSWLPRHPFTLCPFVHFTCRTDLNECRGMYSLQVDTDSILLIAGQRMRSDG